MYFSLGKLENTLKFKYTDARHTSPQEAVDELSTGGIALFLPSENMVVRKRGMSPRSLLGREPMDMKQLMSWVVWCVMLIIVAFALDYVGWFHAFAVPYWYVALAVVAYALHWMMPIPIGEAQ